MAQLKTIEKVIKILKKETKKFKNPIVTEVSYDKDPYKVLISCLLSLRTKDAVTAKAANNLFKKAKTPSQMSKLKEKQIQKLIYPVGFYRVKSKRIKEISKALIKDCNGKVPSDMDELLKLKGVGRKTANIVLVFGFNKNALPIDIHCHRIPNRLGWIKTKTPEQTEMELKKILPKKYWIDFNNIFVVFGQNICVPVSPFCSKCPIYDYCPRIGVKKHR